MTGKRRAKFSIFNSLVFLSLALGKLLVLKPGHIRELREPEQQLSKQKAVREILLEVSYTLFHIAACSYLR